MEDVDHDVQGGGFMKRKIPLWVFAVICTLIFFTVDTFLQYSLWSSILAILASIEREKAGGAFSVTRPTENHQF